MPRKRTTKSSTTETQTESQATQTATLEPPDAGIPAPIPNPVEPAASPVAEQPAAPVSEKPTFVERLQQQRRPATAIAPDPFGIAGDYVAGVRLFESRRDRVMAIKFEERPGEAVLAVLKNADYRWNPRDKVWVHPILPESARATRIDAERLYQEVRGLIRQEKGIESGQEIPF
jgi:hypothetical protein